MSCPLQKKNVIQWLPFLTKNNVKRLMKYILLPGNLRLQRKSFFNTFISTSEPWQWALREKANKTNGDQGTRKLPQGSSLKKKGCLKWLPRFYLAEINRLIFLWPSHFLPGFADRDITYNERAKHSLNFWLSLRSSLPQFNRCASEFFVRYRNTQLLWDTQEW